MKPKFPRDGEMKRSERLKRGQPSMIDTAREFGLTVLAEQYAPTPRVADDHYPRQHGDSCAGRSSGVTAVP